MSYSSRQHLQCQEVGHDHPNVPCVVLCVVTFVFLCPSFPLLHTPDWKPFVGKILLFYLCISLTCHCTWDKLALYHTCVEIKARFCVLCVVLKISILKISPVQEKKNTNYLVLFIPKV